MRKRIFTGGSACFSSFISVYAQFIIAKERHIPFDLFQHWLLSAKRVRKRTPGSVEEMYHLSMAGSRFRLVAGWTYSPARNGIWLADNPMGTFGKCYGSKCGVDSKVKQNLEIYAKIGGVLLTVVPAQWLYVRDFTITHPENHNHALGYHSGEYADRLPLRLSLD